MIRRTGSTRQTRVDPVEPGWPAQNWDDSSAGQPAHPHPGQPSRPGSTWKTRSVPFFTVAKSHAKSSDEDVFARASLWLLLPALLALWLALPAARA